MLQGVVKGFDCRVFKSIVDLTHDVCDMLQSVAVCCVLQGVAVCCKEV